MLGKRYKPHEEVTEENYKRVFAKELLALFLSGLGVGVGATWLAFPIAELHGTLWALAFFIFVTASITYLMWDGIKEVVDWWSATIVDLAYKRVREATEVKEEPPLDKRAVLLVDEASTPRTSEKAIIDEIFRLQRLEEVEGRLKFEEVRE